MKSIAPLDRVFTNCAGWRKTAAVALRPRSPIAVDRTALFLRRRRRRKKKKERK